MTTERRIPLVVVELREITRENWRQCLSLTVRDDQRHFVASNAHSLVEASYEPGRLPLGVYHGDTMVGFVMYTQTPGPEPGFFILRVMVDAAQQGRGLGRAAVTEVLERLRRQPGCREVRISAVPANRLATELYESLGFARTGEMIGAEEVLRLTFPAEESG
jgi:diamine N-acetyltransferase